MADSRSTLATMLGLAAPVLLEQVLNILVAFVDQWLAGRYLQEEHLAAIGLIWYVLWTLPALFAMVAVGGTALVARSVGAGDYLTARRATNQALLVGGILALGATVLLAAGGERFVRLMQLPEPAVPLATGYLWYLLPVIPAMMIEQVGIACLRGAGDTLSGFVAMAIVNLINALLGTALVIGWGPFPQMGWEGLALATAVGHAVGGALVTGLLLAGRARLPWRLSLMRPDRDLIRRLLRVGIPGGMDMLMIVACHLWFLSVINTLGVVPSAAHSLAIRIESLAYLPAVAFQVAASTLAGQSLGAGDRGRAAHSGWLALLVGGTLMSLAGVTFFWGADQLTQAFVGQQNSAVAAAAAPLLRVVAFSMPSLALVMVLSGSLRGAGDTRWPLLITFAGLLGLRIPLAYWLAWQQIALPAGELVIAGWGLGVIGAWYAMLADLVFRSGLILWRFLHGGWLDIRV